MVPDRNEQSTPIGHCIPGIDRRVQDGGFKFGRIDFHPRFLRGWLDLNLHMTTQRASQHFFQCVNLNAEVDDLRPDDLNRAGFAGGSNS